MNKSKGLIIFSKYPEYGKVKTRLAATIGNEKAIKFYTVCAQYLFDNAKKLKKSVEIFLFYSPVKDLQKVKEWVSEDFTFIPQTGNDLGKRMQNAFTEIFNRGMKKVVIVGTDIPDVTYEVLTDAFGALDKNDIVIGPSYDGGYYLLGMRKPFPGLFENIEWSTGSVFDSTIKKIKKLNLSFFTLPKLHDVDTEMELLNWLNSKQGNKSFKEKLRKAVFEND